MSVLQKMRENSHSIWDFSEKTPAAATAVTAPPARPRVLLSPSQGRSPTHPTPTITYSSSPTPLQFVPFTATISVLPPFPTPFTGWATAEAGVSRPKRPPPPAPTPEAMAVPYEVGGSVAALIALGLVLLVLPPGVSPNAEGDALYAFRRGLADPDNVLQSWDPTLVTPCTWFHITCDQGNRVTRIDLGNSNLSGHLVPELGKLEHLQYLELYKNNIQGTMPSELGNLKSLISLDLYNNNISGIIPPTLGKLKSLVLLRLNGNHLTGQIPRELAKISSLKVVDVSNNDLCGTIPTTGPFEHIPLNNFENNPRLEGPALQGLAAYDTNC